MFNWLFGKKEVVIELPTAVETVIVNEEITEALVPVYEEPPKEVANIDFLFEAFPDLRRICEIEYNDMCREHLVRMNRPSLIKEARSVIDILNNEQGRLYRQLRLLPKIDIKLYDDLTYGVDSYCAYLTEDGEFVKIGVTSMGHYTYRFKTEPPVLRIAKNILNNFDSWNVSFITSKGGRDVPMALSEHVNHIAKFGGYGIYIEKCLTKQGIEILCKRKELKVLEDVIPLSENDIELLDIITNKFIRVLIDQARDLAAEVEKQTRMSMDETVAELFKGEYKCLEN